MARRKIAVADCETDPFKKGRVIIAPFIWGFYDGDNYLEFTDTGEFVEFVKTQPIILYAHNGGKFDWLFLLPYIGDFTDAMLINGRLAKFKIGACEFRDSYNILPTPLSAYQKDEIDYALMEKGVRHKPENMRKIRSYLKGDCVYLYDLVMGFVDKYGLSLTLAGAAIKQWQKISGKKADRSKRKLYDDIKDHYHGGRVQAFRRGEFNMPLKMIDINSAYPRAMMELHPYGLRYEISSELPSTDAYIARCFISLECISRGAFPFRDVKNLALEFPDDNERRIYHVTGWEYLAALRTNTISDVKIVKVVQFSDSISFEDYVKKFYAEKEAAEKKSKEYIYAKLFLNTLYGKWGANPEKYNSYQIIPAQFIMEHEMEGWEFNSWLPAQKALMSKPLEEEEQRYFNVAVAASITGYVRAFLWESICQTENPLYCDTDSIICGDVGSLELDAKKLGAWDVETVSNYCAIAGKKLYYIKGADGYPDKQASKGARLTPEEIIRVARGETVTYDPIAPSMSVKGGFRLITRKIKMT